MTEWKESYPKMSDRSKMLSTLGLCVRAGKTVCGVPMICEAMRKGGKNAPLLVLESSDTSENTHKRITDKCAYYRVKHVRLNVSGEELGASVGKSSNIGAIALTDKGLSELIEKYI